MFSSPSLKLILLGLLPTLALASELTNLRGTAQDDLIDSLPGLSDKINFKQYSGYLKADDNQETNKYFHYWFVESQSNPRSDPLVLWLNGGPGCSSLEGFFAELGPFKVSQNSKRLDLNQYSWNKIANVLFISSPAGVGFSYAKDGNTDTDDDDTAKSNHLALRDFFVKFPQFKTNNLYLMGESYGGVYLPTLGVLVDADKEMNLTGVGIGNGYLDAQKLGESLIFFGYYHGLYGKALWDRLSVDCCNGKPPARGSCDFGPVRSGKCSNAVQDAADLILNSGLNPYNLYGKCDQVKNHYLTVLAKIYGYTGFSGREEIERQLMLHSLNLKLDTGNTMGLQSSYLNATHTIRDAPPCVDESATIDYVNQKSVRKAIHIPERIQPWDICTRINYRMIYPQRPGGLAPQIKKLIRSPRKLRLLIYNGDVDMMCNFIGDEWFVDDLGQKVVNEYRPWLVDGQVAGYSKGYEGITFMTIKGSGHMVPQDKPKESYEFFQSFISKRRAQMES